VRLRALLLGLLALVGLGLPLPARAQDPSEAHTHYEAGKAAFAEGRYKDAIHELQIAYDLDPNPALVFNIARAYEEDLQLERAITLFQQVADNAPSPKDREAADTRIAKSREIQAKLGLYGVVRGFPRGRYVEVFFDGERLAFDERERFGLFPPGRHEIEFRYPGGLKMTVFERLPLGEVIDLREIARRHAVIEIQADPEHARVRLDGDLVPNRIPRTVTAGPHTITVEAEGHEKAVQDVDLSPEVRTPVRVALVSFATLAALAAANELPSYPLWAGGGAALAGVVTGVTLQALASAERGRIHDATRDEEGRIYGLTQAQAKDAEDRAQRYLVGAYVGYGLAGAAALFEAVYAVYYARSLGDPPGGAAPFEPASSWHVTVSPGGVGVGGTF